MVLHHLGNVDDGDGGGGHCVCDVCRCDSKMGKKTDDADCGQLSGDGGGEHWHGNHCHSLPPG